MLKMRATKCLYVVLMLRLTAAVIIALLENLSSLNSHTYLNIILLNRVKNIVNCSNKPIIKDILIMFHR